MGHKSQCSTGINIAKPIERCSLYARVSKGGTEQNPENQLIKLRAYAAAQGWAIQGEYVDRLSGLKDHRPQLDALRTACKARWTDAVLATRLDRLGRSTIHLLTLFDEFEVSGVRVIITDQNIDTTTPIGKFIRTLLAAIAELEREFISERTKDGLARARAEGKRLGRPRKVLRSIVPDGPISLGKR